MVTPTPDSSVSAFLESVWGKRARGLDVVATDWNRPVLHQDVEYLLNRYPFLQIITTDENPVMTPVQLIRAESGWVIHEYGAAMSSSPGEFLFAGGNWQLFMAEEDGDNGDATVNPGKGTVIKQAFDTATEMMAIAKQKGWPGIFIVAGSPVMCWAAWVAAQELKLEIQGYEPTAEDKRKRDRLQRTGALKEVLPKLGK